MIQTEKVGNVTTWDEAFKRAFEYLNQQQLTAVAIVPKADFERKTAYFATHLEEFGKAHETLTNLKATAPLLYPKAATIELHHGNAEYSRPNGLVSGWMLIMVHND